MSTASIVALIGAVTALVTAIGGVIAVLRHANGPSHQNGVTASSVEAAFRVHTQLEHAQDTTPHVAPSPEQVRAAGQRWRKKIEAVRERPK